MAFAPTGAVPLCAAARGPCRGAAGNACAAGNTSGL
eukprot:CAMPEP_0171117340 /NCGR_PEP_ID=MMETSP0766_2-20121228/92243_1 /TAXON_ID=439317 /ORGANISM="Gambierdiscus australes, Strain CAWD 149" /LENGTH=35 /DNA_ID= /DNA_START= /DNA_END= /DNA_ORIENTATION=